jgi:hypothetical protein
VILVKAAPGPKFFYAKLSRLFPEPAGKEVNSITLKKEERERDKRGKG